MWTLANTDILDNLYTNMLRTNTPNNIKEYKSLTTALTDLNYYKNNNTYLFIYSLSNNTGYICYNNNYDDINNIKNNVNMVLKEFINNYKNLDKHINNILEYEKNLP